VCTEWGEDLRDLKSRHLGGSLALELAGNPREGEKT